MDYLHAGRPEERALSSGLTWLSSNVTLVAQEGYTFAQDLQVADAYLQELKGDPAGFVRVLDGKKPPPALCAVARW